MRKSSRVFFVLWSVLVLLLIITEVWCAAYPMHALHNDLRCLAAEFHNMCQQESLQYWICSGTLLGSIRHGDIIHHDDDIDVAVKLSDLEQLQSLAPKYNLQMTPGIWSGCWQFRKTGLQGFIDIFLVNQYQNRYAFTGMARTLWPNETFDLDDTFATPYPLGKYRTQLQPETFVDLVLWGPNRASNVDYCQKAYGPCWFVPKVTQFHTLTAFRETFFYSVSIALLVLGLLGVQVRQCVKP